MPKIIDIDNFKGLWTNADLEDLPLEATVIQQNLRVVPGKLEKTCGFGDTGESAITIEEPTENFAVKNIETFIHSGLTNDYEYMWIQISSASNLVAFADTLPSIVND